MRIFLASTELDSQPLPKGNTAVTVAQGVAQELKYILPNSCAIDCSSRHRLATLTKSEVTSSATSEASSGDMA